MASPGWATSSAAPAPASVQMQPEWLYVNSDGLFRLNRNVGVAEYVWPPCAFDDGTQRDNSDLKAHRDELEFVRWVSISTPDAQDEGWIYKVKSANFWLLFGDQVFHDSGQRLFKLYYSDNGTQFLRWRTLYGTRRAKPAPMAEGSDLSVIDEGPIAISKPKPIPPDGTTDPQFGGPGEVPANTLRFDVGSGKLPNEGRACWKHGVDTRSQFVLVYAEIKHPTIDTIKNDVTDCVRTSSSAALIAAAVAAYYSGGTASWATAKATFIATFKSCMYAKIGAIALKLIPELKFERTTGNWSGH